MTVQGDLSTAPHSGLKKGKKYFTLDEANRALSYVSPIVQEITGTYRQAVSIHQRLENLTTDDHTSILQDEYEACMDRLNVLIDELRHAGVELKDFEMGLLDFPSVHEGREIYLCWHQNETSVHAWHEIDAGFTGRQDVAVLHG